jgi:hypothetical protein
VIKAEVIKAEMIKAEAEAKALSYPAEESEVKMREKISSEAQHFRNSKRQQFSKSAGQQLHSSSEPQHFRNSTRQQFNKSAAQERRD